jgi:hypothetical protein
MRIALSESSAGRRKKGEASKKGSLKWQRSSSVAAHHPIPESRPNQVEEVQAFDLEVVLPFPDSGLNLLLNPIEGGSVSEQARSGEGRIPEAEEALKLLDIQKKVGFSFVDNEIEILGRLEELEKVDRANNVVRVSEEGF